MQSATHDALEISTDENRGHLSQHCFIHVNFEIGVENTKQIHFAQFHYAEVLLNICSLIVWHVSFYVFTNFADYLAISYID